MPAFSNPEAYERWMGRWSMRLAPIFVNFAGIADTGRVLDVGAGTGVLGAAIAHAYANVEVIGVEPAADYVDQARSIHTNRRLSFQVGDAQALPFPDAEFDASLALLILQELPDAKTAAQEMQRVTRPGGIVAACQWDFRDGMPMTSLFWETVLDICADGQTQEAAARRTAPGYCDVESLADLWKKAGIQRPQTARMAIIQEFTSFDDYWSPFLSNATPTSSYAATLPAKVRQDVAAALRQRLIGGGPDRPFTLKAEAVAVRGTAP